MSIEISLDELNTSMKKKIVMDLHFKKCVVKKRGGNNHYSPNDKEIIPYRINEQNTKISLPFYYAKNLLCFHPRVRASFDEIQEYTNIYSNLRPTQLEVFQEVLNSIGNQNTALLALHVGFGKSILATAIANKIKLKTLIITHRVLLSSQWKESLEKWSSIHKTCIFNPKKTTPNCDFLICSALNISKIPNEIISKIGFVIVDECHLISTECFSKSLNYLFPRYLLGLSATPYRNDGMDKLMDFYFGTKRFVRSLKMQHTVYKIQTSFEPKIILNRNGDMDWSYILEQQCMHEERNHMIIELCQKFTERRILILCKRVLQAQMLLEIAQSKNLSVTSLVGNKVDFDKDASILIATVQKAGVGFSHDILDTLILASDVEEYYIQYLGRVARRPDVIPLIFDIVDKNKTLQNHFRTRKKVYEEIGGKIVDLQKDFPDFQII